MKNVLIAGASGHGGMVLDCLKKEGRYRVIGFIDSFKRKGTVLNGLEVLGAEIDLPRLMDLYNISGIIVAIGNNWSRKVVVEKIAHIAPCLEMITTIHPSATLGIGVKIGKGSVVMPGALVNANAIVGDCCILNTNSSLGHDGRMCDFSSISSGVCTGGNLFLGRCSAISLGANIIENINVGAHSLIGAGALVIKDVQSHCVVHGSPARFVRERESQDPYLNGDTHHLGICKLTI